MKGASGRKKARRTLKDVQVYLSAKEVYDLITSKTHNYKDDETRERLEKRDRALMAIDFVGAFRNNETLLYHTNQAKKGDREEINMQALRKRNFVESPSGLILQNGKISKRSEKVLRKIGARATIREDIVFPRYDHPLKPFTDLVEDYLVMLKEDDVLFRFGERRHHQIVKEITGEWPHWLRSMGENWYGHNVFINDPLSLAKFVGVLNVQSVMPYVGLDVKAYRERLKRASQTDNR
jgi:hypothetical protein